MAASSRQFQIFVKPTGSICNLDCRYCYYLEKEKLYPKGESFRMTREVLEEYISQHIGATQENVVMFSWHGGEPTVLGLDYFRRIVDIQRKYRPSNMRIVNGIQTNGTLIDDEWCRFFAENEFAVGISLDGPRKIHDRYRQTKEGSPTFDHVMRGYRLLQKHGVPTEILCVVNAYNVQFPIQVYRFFKKLKAQYITFLPLVEHKPQSKDYVSDISVPAKKWGHFLCTIFDEWIDKDIGLIKVQIFEEVLRTAFNQEHSLCIFRPVCGDVPVIEHNGDFYSCDHFVDNNHLLGNIMETPLVEFLESPKQRSFGEAKLLNLPFYCKECDVRSMCNGECPKNRFITAPDGELGLNYLCDGYKQFFTHCKPFVLEVANLWKEGKNW
jgi:uncharacterized protein